MVSKLKLILFNLLLLAVLLLLVEGALRLSDPDYPYYYRTHVGQPDLEEILAKTDTHWLQPQAQLGWVCQQKSFLQFPTPPVQGIEYQINKQGFRNDFDFDQAMPENKKRVLLLGDSFMFGIYLAENETITSRLQAAKGEGYLFYNISVPAWGLDQMYLAYQQYVDLIQPDQVILAFLDDDLIRSLEILFHGCGRKPCLKLEGEQLVTNEDNPHWWEYLCWNNQIGNRLLRIYYQNKAAQLAQFMLKDLIRMETQSGRIPVFVRIPRLEDLQHKRARKVFCMSELTEAEGVPYLQWYDSLVGKQSQVLEQLYIPDDGHFTPEGARLFANDLLEYID